MKIILACIYFLSGGFCADAEQFAMTMDSHGKITITFGILFQPTKGASNNETHQH